MHVLTSSQLQERRLYTRVTSYFRQVSISTAIDVVDGYDMPISLDER